MASRKEKAEAEAAEAKAAKAKAAEEKKAAENEARSESIRKDAEAIEKAGTTKRPETQGNTNDIRSIQDWGVAKANADLAMGAAVRFNLDFDNDMINEKEYNELIDKFGKGTANVK